MENKASKKWKINVVSFVLLVILALTGLVNWLILPQGCGTHGGFLISLRHFFREVHEWTSVLFLISLGFHLYFNWSYVKANLKKSGLLK